MEPRREPVSRTAETRFDGCGCMQTESASIRIKWPWADTVQTGTWPLSLVSAERQITKVESRQPLPRPAPCCYGTQLTDPSGPSLDLNGWKSTSAIVTEDSPPMFAVQGTAGGPALRPRCAERG